MKEKVKSLLCIIAFICTTLSISAQVLGPYPINTEVTIPDNYTKVVVYSSPEYSGGYIVLENIETGKQISLHASVTYVATWYFFVPNGKYTIVECSSDYDISINGINGVPGAIVTFNTESGGYIGFYLKDN